MVFKILAVVAVLFIVYLIFFKKNRESEVEQTHAPKKKKDKIEDIMEECPTCGTFVSKKEAILSNGRYFCSKECLK